MINFEINNSTIQAKVGERLIDVADRENINIPRFCYHKKLSVAANCRMCLVKVEGAPKLMPACTTYVTEGMKISTISDEVKAAQKSVMEFLLINHPLDCPVCDQAGECELQDVSLEYGYASSKFIEQKRSFINPDIGPLISTELNRCIQCSRCVRFGQEIAGVMELGLSGRGMHTSINTFLNRSMDSEISGNVIDLCPVGALTAKPSRFVGRSWEMEQREFIATHDSLGSNGYAHIYKNEIVRLTPKENESLNETWLSDIDRFSYQGNYVERLETPKIKQNGKWQVSTWQEALELVSSSLAQTKESLDILLNPNQSAETLFMAKKFANQFNSSALKSCVSLTSQSNNSGFEAQAKNKIPSSLSEISGFEQYIFIGIDLRYKEPLINLAVRKGVQKGASVISIAIQEYDFAYSVNDFNSERIKQYKAAPHQFLKAVQQEINSISQNVKRTLIIVGDDALMSPNFAEFNEYLQSLVKQEDKEMSLLYLTNGSNSKAGEYLDYNLIKEEETKPVSENKNYLLVDIEPHYDLANSALALEKLKKANFVVALSIHQNETIEAIADVILPLASNLESGGSYLNLLEELQSFSPVILPLAESKPAWKIFTVIEQFLKIELKQSNNNDIAYYTLSELSKSVAQLLAQNAKTSQKQVATSANSKLASLNISDDEIVFCSVIGSSQRQSSLRRASAIQKTSWAKKEKLIRMNSKTAQRLGVNQGRINLLFNGDFFAQGSFIIDEKISDNLVLLPSKISPVNYALLSEKTLLLVNKEVVKQSQTGS